MRGRKKHVVSSFSYPIDKVDTIMEAEHRAEKEGKTLSQLITHLLEQYNESKKAEGLNATPIAIAYVNNSHFNTQQSSLSVFRDFDTVKSVYNRLQSEQVTLDAWNELDRYQKNFKAGLMAYKPNIIQR